jgi:tRNA threonylcarbamoyladenosine dehydratase
MKKVVMFVTLASFNPISPYLCVTTLRNRISRQQQERQPIVHVVGVYGFTTKATTAPSKPYISLHSRDDHCNVATTSNIRSTMKDDHPTARVNDEQVAVVRTPSNAVTAIVNIDNHIRHNNSLTSNESDYQNNSENNNNDSNSDDHHIRFRGIGRLYSSSTSSASIIGSSENRTSSDTTNKSVQQNDTAIIHNDSTTATTTTTVSTIQEQQQGSTTTSDRLVLQRLQSAVVVVVGVGGVGSWTVEALGRSGIGTLVLIDLDDICISNVNRQVQALSDTIGSMKIDVLYQRLQQINPNCTVHRIYDFVTANNVYEMFDTIAKNWGTAATTTTMSAAAAATTTTTTTTTCNSNQKQITAVLDCMDDAREKAALIAYCNHRSIPICTVGSTAGRMNPSKVVFGDITHVHTTTMGHSRDRLLFTVRKTLRQQYNFTPGRPFGRRSKAWNIPCVYSEEEVNVPQQPQPYALLDNQTHIIPDSISVSSSFRQCDNGVLGTASFVTGTFGFVAASIIVQGIAQNALHPPCGTK